MEILSGVDAAEAVAAETANLMIYGGPGFGKTTQAVEAFTENGRCSALFLQCEHGALKPILRRQRPDGLPAVIPDSPRDSRTGEILTIVGWDPLWEAIQHVAVNRARYNAIILDNLTSWTASTQIQLQQQGLGKRNGWEIPVRIRDYLTVLRDVCRQLRVHVVYIAHAREPYIEDGIFYPGGPSLNPKKASNLFYGAVDTMLRTDLMMIGGKLQRVFYTGGLEWDTATLGMQPPSLLQWFQKNREGVQQAVVPANLGQYLRSCNPPYRGL